MCDRFGSDDVKVILLCESPHTSEVCAGYPLAGDSGKDVTEVLSKWMPKDYRFDTEPIHPIGKLVSQQGCRIPWLGIMNVSELPFQDKAYQDDDACRGCAKWSSYIKSMKYLRKNPKERCPQNDCRRALNCAIVKDLKSRLRSLDCRLRARQRNILLIRCGKVAKEYYKKADVNGSWCIYDAPHPSRSQWKHYLILEKLKSCIENRLP